MPERDEREAPAPVGRGVVEQHVHRPRAEREQARPRRVSAKPAIASTVTRTARCASARPARASSPARCGSSEPWTAWKSCSGARAISSTLNTKPATTASSAVRSLVSTAALSSVCSASMIASTASAKRPPRATPRSPVPARGRCGRRGRPARERERHDDERHERRRRHAERDRGLALRDPDRDREREQQPRRSPPGTRARRRARTTGARRASRARSSSPRRPAPRRRGSSTAPPSRRTARPAIGPRSASATAANASAKPPWISSGVRSGWSCSSPRARRSAIVRESSCSIGR